jgi:MFS family permease
MCSALNLVQPCPSFVGLTLLTLLLYGALGGLFVLVPYVLLQVGGYTATQAGAALLPLPQVIAVASPVAGVLAAKVGPRWLLITGPVTVATGFLLAMRIGSHTSYWLGVFPAMVVIALGMAGAVARSRQQCWCPSIVTTRVQHRGLNSAVARTGGLVIGPVMASSGPALLSALVLPHRLAQSSAR